jgi:glycosyltransferase involved in cell wall biosynthesis
VSILLPKIVSKPWHDTLSSVADFAEIILVDSGSTDKTIEIAQAFNCKIYHQEWLGFAKQKQLALVIVSMSGC